MEAGIVQPQDTRSLCPTASVFVRKVRMEPPRVRHVLGAGALPRTFIIDGLGAGGGGGGGGNFEQLSWAGKKACSWAKLEVSESQNRRTSFWKDNLLP